MATIVRAQVAHTPRNPFVSEDALEVFWEGALGFSAGRIVGCRRFDDIRAGHPDAHGLDGLDARDTVALGPDVESGAGRSLLTDRPMAYEVRMLLGSADVRVVRRVV